MGGPNKAVIPTSPLANPPVDGHVTTLRVDSHASLLGDVIYGQQTISEATLVAGVDPTQGSDVLVTLTADRVMGLPLNGVAGQRLHLIITEGGAGGFHLAFNAGIAVKGFAPNPAPGDRTDLWLACLSPTSWLGALSPAGAYGTTSVIVAPTGVNLQSEGCDMSGGVAGDAAWTRSVIDLPSGGGKIFMPPGTPRFATQKTLFNGLTLEGSGMGATVITRDSALGTAPLFLGLVSNHGAIRDIFLRDFAIDGVTGPAGTAELIRLDTTAFNDILYKNIAFERLKFLNAKFGGIHGGNNGGTGAATHRVRWHDITAENCAYGIGYGGTYGEEISHCLFDRCTKWGLSTYGVPFNDGGFIGVGPTTVCDISHIHAEGLGLYSSGVDGGVAINASNSRASDLFISNVSGTGLLWENSEYDLENLLNNVQLYGCGGGIDLWGGTQQGGTIRGLILQACGQNKTNWPGGYAQRQFPLMVESGIWQIDGGSITQAGLGTAPDYLIGMGNGLNAITRLEIARMDFISPYLLGLYISYDANARPRFRDCPGKNPVGVEVVAVPASGVAIAAADHDRSFYISTGAGVTTMAIQNGPTIPLQASTAGQQVRLPAGKTMTPTYANAYTNVVMGE